MGWDDLGHDISMAYRGMESVSVWRSRLNF